MYTYATVKKFIVTFTIAVMHVYANAEDMEDKPVKDVLITSFLSLSNHGLKHSKKHIQSFHVHKFVVPQANKKNLNWELFCLIHDSNSMSFLVFLKIVHDSRPSMK